MAAEIVVAKITEKLCDALQLAHNWAFNIQHCIPRMIAPTKWLLREKGWRPLYDVILMFIVCIQVIIDFNTGLNRF